MNISEYIDYRLNEWADWYLRYGDFGLGYPKKSIEGKLIDNGGVLIKASRHDFSCNTAAEEIERLVIDLTEQNKRLALVLREQYFGVGSIVCKAKRLGLSYGYFKVQLDMAKQWLTGRLSSSYRGKTY